MYTTTDTPYPSSRSISPTRQHSSLVSNSRPESVVQKYSGQNRQSVRGAAEYRRPSMYASSSSHGMVGSKIVFEAPVDGMFGDPQPLSTLYHPFTNGQTSVEQRPLDMPDLDSYARPIIARSNARKGTRPSQLSSRSPPYPVHGQGMSTASPGAEQMPVGGSLRQPTVEDFLRLQSPLPAVPVDEYDSDQESPVIESDAIFHDQPINHSSTHHQGVSSEQLNATSLGRYGTVASANPSRVSREEVSHKRSKSVSVTPSTPARVPTMGSDMFSPALGGLHKVGGLPQKETKLDRVKRFWRDMKRGGSFRRRREFGGVSHQSIE